MIDADCLAPPDWLRRLTEKIVKGEEVATMGFEADKIKNYWTRARQDEDWNFLKTRLKDDYAHHIDTKNFAIRSDILKDLKFDTRLIAYEDWDLFIRCQAAGHKIRFLPEIIVAHHHDSSLFQLFKTQFYRGRESLFIIKKYKKMPDCRQIFRNDQNFRAARLINFLTFFPWVIWQFVCRPKRAPYLVVSDAAWKAGLIAFWLHPKKRLDN